jgi:3-hydroxymyristoyl/3-hydroxydecanoyl-(acyl carrier protein) dehydratase
MPQIIIPPDAPYLRGHFDGRPIVAGVVELILLIEHLSREAGTSLALRSSSSPASGSSSFHTTGSTSARARSKVDSCGSM